MVGIIFGTMLFFVLLCIIGNRITSGNSSDNTIPLKVLESPEAEKPIDTNNLVVSEPVISFVETVRKSPQRFFTWQGLKSFSYISREAAYYIWDKKTGEWWDTNCNFPPSISISHHVYKKNAYRSDHSWLTEYEMKYLIAEITAIYKSRQDRVKKLEDIRKQRRDRAERNRLIKLYAGGEGA